MEGSRKVPWSQRLTVRLTGGVILALLLIGLPFLLAFHRHLRGQQLDSLSRATLALSRVIVAGLESSMLDGHPHQFDDTVRSLTREKVVDKALLIDHTGRVRVSSDPEFEGRTLDRNADEPCRICHLRSDDPPTGTSTLVTDAGDRKIFRSMTLIPNRAECHSCHDASRATNGILVMDLALEEADGTFFSNIGGTAALGTIMVLLTIGVLIFLLRRLVHEPLKAIVSTSRRIVEGDLAARAEVASPGEFGVLSDRVNRMTRHLALSIERLENQRHQLQEILEAVDDEIVVLGRDQRIVAANRAFRVSRGQPDGDVTGQACRDVTFDRFPCLPGESSCPVRQVFQTGRHQKGIASRRRPDGHEQVIEIHASPVLGPDGSVHQAVEVRRDISERRQMEASLAQSERLASLGLLASGISHELNNPLGAISASVEGLRRRLASGEAMPEKGGLERNLALISDQVSRGRSITDRLLRLARTPSEARGLIDVHAVLEDTLAVLAHQMRRAGIEVRTEFGEGLAPVRGDPSSLAQVMMNLCLNALQAMEGRKGVLKVVTGAVDHAIRIEIHDTGPGIPPALRSRVYEPFFTTKPPGRGTGLGLFISHRLVTEMGGSIALTSDPGRGTVFTVILPRHGAEAAS